MTRVDSSRVVWRKSSRSGALNGGGGECVELAALGDGRIVVRDSKCPGGAVLVFPRATLAAWIGGLRSDEVTA